VSIRVESKSRESNKRGSWVWADSKSDAHELLKLLKGCLFSTAAGGYGLDVSVPPRVAMALIKKNGGRLGQNKEGGSARR